MSWRVSVSVLFLSLLAPALASAQSGWDASFTPGAVASYLRDHHKALLVVGSGELPAERDAAVAALARGVRESRRASVMTGESLGDVSALDDAAIVKKAAHLPVVLIGVLRVFPGAEGEQPAAVVSFYGKDGQAVTALSVQKGTALQSATGAPAAVSAGASAEAIAAVETLKTHRRGGDARDDIALPPELESSYDEQALVVNVDGARWTAIRKNRPKERLDATEFFNALGRQDLVESYESNRIVKYALVGSGGLLTLAGIGAVLYPLFDGCEFLGTPQCDSTQLLTAILAVTIGPAVAGFGIRLFIGGLVWDAHPINAAEARLMADEHNRKLRSNLLSPSARRDGPPLQLGVRVSQNGGGLSLAFQF